MRPGVTVSMRGVSSLVSRLVRRRPVDLGDAPATATVVPDAEPYYGGSGPNGVLLCHGFSGSPQSMRAWAEHLEADGFRVVLPRLPGHGTTWQELNQTRWEDWYACVDRAFADLRAECDRVFCCGLSMGGGLALRIAEQHGNAVAGLALVNPSIGSDGSAVQAAASLAPIRLALPGRDRQRHRPTRRPGDRLRP